jgi:hypothetical protein
VRHQINVRHQIKLRQPIGRKDSLQAVCRKTRRLEAFLYFVAQNLELFTKIQDKKNIKPVAVDVLS